MKQALFRNVLAMFTLLVSIASYAQSPTWKVNGMCYEILSEKDKTVGLTDRYVTIEANVISTEKVFYNGAIKIPSTVQINGSTYTVTEILPGCFAYSKLTELTIPASIVKIDAQGFSNDEWDKSNDEIKYAFQKVIVEDGDTPLIIAGSSPYYRERLDMPKDWYIGRNLISAEDGVVIQLEFFTADETCDVSLTFGDKVTSLDGIGVASGKIKKLSIGKGIAEIPYHFFYSVDNLEFLSLSEGLKVIGEGAFGDTYSHDCPLTELVIPSSVEKIGGDAFAGCYNLKKLTIADSDKTLVLGEDGQFLCCPLESFYLGRNIALDDEEHYRASLVFNSAKAMTVGDKVTELPAGLFSETGIETVTLGKNLKKIGESIFWRCHNLKNIEIPSGISEIPWHAFAETGITKLDLPEGVKSIGEAAFSACVNLSEIVIPSSVTEIGHYAFGELEHVSLLKFVDGKDDLRIDHTAFDLTRQAIDSVYVSRNIIRFEEQTGVLLPTTIVKLEIGGNMVDVSDYFAAGNNDLTLLNINYGVKTIGEGAFESLTNLEHVTLPNSLESIGKEAFQRCLKLQEIEIPGSVKSIGDLAFNWCDALMSVEVEWLNPFEIPENTFLGRYDNATLLVPNGTVDVYKNTPFWSKFLNVKVSRWNVKAETSAGGTVTVLDMTATEGNPVIGVIKTGRDLVVTTNADEGYELKSLIVNGKESINDVTNGILTIKQVEEDQEIKAVYKKKTFLITVEASDGGNVLMMGKTTEGGSPITATVEWDDDIEFTIEESEDCLLASVIINGTDVTSDIKDGKYIIKKVREAKNVVATFAQSVLKHLRITDGKKYDQTEAFTTQKLTYKRTFSNTTGWDLLVLPASLDYADWKDQLEIAHIYDVNVYDENGDGEVDLTEIEAVVMTKGSTLANYPYLVRSKKSGEVIITRGETMVQKPVSLSLECSNTIMKFTITGNYEAIPAATVSANKWYVMKDGVWTAGANDLGYMRAYLQIEKKAGSYSQTPIPQKISTKIDGSGIGVFGDLNGDGVVNAADHVKLSDIIMKQ